jgi:hypothetical protein
MLLVKLATAGLFGMIAVVALAQTPSLDLVPGSIVSPDTTTRQSQIMIETPTDHQAIQTNG